MAIDWLGPVPLPADSDEDGVHVNEKPKYLSEEEARTLKEHVALSDVLIEETMTHSFTVGKYSCTKLSASTDSIKATTLMCCFV